MANNGGIIGIPSSSVSGGIWSLKEQYQENIDFDWGPPGSERNPAESALEIQNYNPNAQNGFYWIRQTGATAYQHYCVFKNSAGSAIAGGPWTVPIVSGQSNSLFSTNGAIAAAQFVNQCVGVGVNTPGRGMESSRTTTEVHGAWLAVKRALWEAYPSFISGKSSTGGSVLRMPIINVNGDNGSSAHRIVSSPSVSTHLPPNIDGDACNANQLFCGFWGGTDFASWTTNNDNIPGPEDWGVSDTNNSVFTGSGLSSTLTVCVYR